MSAFCRQPLLRGLAASALVVLAYAPLAPGAVAASSGGRVESPSPPVSAGALSFSLSGGFSGWANPLPNYALDVSAQDEDAGAYFNDLSITPLRIRVTNSSRVNVPFVVRLRNHATPLVPAAIEIARERRARAERMDEEEDATSVARSTSGLVEWEETLRSGSVYSVPVLARQENLIARKESTQDFLLPVALLPLRPDTASVGLRVEILVRGELALITGVHVRFLPSGGVYSALIANESDKEIALDEVRPKLPMAAEQIPPNFRFNHGVVTVPLSMLGPNHTVLRHFQYVLMPAELVPSLGERERRLLADALSMGSRLVVFRASSSVEVAGKDYLPESGLLWHRVGFGEVAITSLTFPGLRRALSEELGERTAEAYRYFQQRDGQVPTSLRSLTMQRLLEGSSFPTYGWVFAGQGGLLEVNPVWAYDYVFNPAFAQPLELPLLHWENLRTPGVFQEKNQALPGRRMGAFPVALQRAFKGDSLRSLAAFILYSTLALVIAVAMVLGFRRSSALLVVLALAVSSFAAFLFLLQRAGVSSAVTDYSQLLFTKGSAGSSVVEREVLLGFYQTGSEPLDFALPLSALTMKRVAPIRQDSFTLLSEQGLTAGVQGFRLNPFLVSEVTLRGVSHESPLFTSEVAEYADGSMELRLANRTERKLRFVLLSVRGSLFDIGPMKPNQEVTVTLPPADRWRLTPEGRSVIAGQQLDLTRSFSQSWTFAREYNAFGRDTAQAKARKALAQAALRMLPRELVADSAGIYVLALGDGALRVSVRGVEHAPAAAAELILYSLK